MVECCDQGRADENWPNNRAVGTSWMIPLFFDLESLKILVQTMVGGEKTQNHLF